MQQHALGPDHPRILDSMANLSSCLAKGKQQDAAADTARQAMEARQRVLGSEHPDTLKSMAALSDRLAKLSQHEAAADMTRQALAGRQRVLGPDHPDTLDSMAVLEHRLAELEHHSKRPDDPGHLADAAESTDGAQSHGPGLHISNPCPSALCCSGHDPMY